MRMCHWSHWTSDATGTRGEPRTGVAAEGSNRADGREPPNGAWENLAGSDNSIQHDRITFTPPPPPPCINPRQVMKSLHFLIVVAFLFVFYLFIFFLYMDIMKYLACSLLERGRKCCYIPVPLSLWRNISSGSAILNSEIFFFFKRVDCFIIGVPVARYESETGLKKKKKNRRLVTVVYFICKFELSFRLSVRIDSVGLNSSVDAEWESEHFRTRLGPTWIRNSWNGSE